MTVSRLALMVTLIFGLLDAPLAADAQPVGKGLSHRLAGCRRPESVELKTFRKALEDLGYVEGRNIVVEYRGAEGKLEQLPDLAQELIRLKPDVIATRGLAATLALSPFSVASHGGLTGPMATYYPQTASPPPPS